MLNVITGTNSKIHHRKKTHETRYRNKPLLPSLPMILSIKKKHYAKVNVTNKGNDGLSNNATMMKRKATQTKINRQLNTNKRSKFFENRREFPYGSVVSINGKYMNDSKWESVHDAPTFLGIVQDPYNHDGWDAEKIDEETE